MLHAQFHCRKVSILIHRIAATAMLLLAVAVLSPRPAAAELPLKYLPEDTNMIISARFQEIHDSPMYTQWKKEFPDFSKGEESFTSETGVAPENIAQGTVAGNIVKKGSASGPTVVFQTRNPVTAEDVKGKIKARSYQKDVNWEETNVGNLTIYQQTYHYAWAQNAAKLEHGSAFVVVESNVIIEGRDIDGLKSIVQRGKPVELTEAMQRALKSVDAAKTLVYAIDLKTVFADEEFVKGFQQGLGPMLPGLSGGDALKQYDSLALDASLAGNDAKTQAVLLCKSAETAGDAKKMAEAAQVLIHQMIQASPRAPQDLADGIKALEFAVDGSALTAKGQAKVDSLVKWMHAEQEHAMEQAKKRAEESLKDAERRRKELEAPPRP